MLLAPPSRGRTLVALLIPLAAAVAVGLWWVREPSLDRRTRRAGVALSVLGGVGLVAVTDLPATVIALLWGLPAAVAAALAAFALTRRGGGRARSLAAGGVFFVALAPWAFLRADGASGQMMPNLVWGPAARASRTEPAPPARARPEISLAATPGDWPGFRGARRDGVVAPAAAAALDLDWRDHPPRECWRRPIGRGWSSFAVVGDLACTQDQAGERERVVCFDAPSGRLAWAHEDAARFDELAGGPGPRATPLIDGGRVYALGATGILNCLDARTGERIWTVSLAGGAAAAPEWGFASSPLAHDGLVYVSPGGVGGTRLAAFDEQTGALVWRASGDAPGYGSPQLMRLAGAAQIVLFDGAGVAGFEPRTGEELWAWAWPEALPRAAQPQSLGDDRVLVGMGYGRGMLSLRLRRDAGELRAEEDWSSTRLKPKFNDFVIHRGHLYGLDEGILVCLDAATGDRLWKGGRYGYGQLLLVGERLLVTTESGGLVVVEASPAGHRELARIDALTGKSWSHPALAGGRLFLRNGSEAVCLELGEA